MYLRFLFRVEPAEAQSLPRRRNLARHGPLPTLVKDNAGRGFVLRVWRATATVFQASMPRFSGV